MNKEQFTTEVLRAEKSMYHIAITILNHEDDCKDAMQNAVLHAFEKLHTLKNENYFKTWIIRILINECNQIIRQRKNQVPYDETYEQSTTAPPRIEDSEVLMTLKELPCDYQIPFVLFYMEDFSVKEISRMLKISPGAVKNRLYRGRIMMKEKLTGGYAYEAQ